MFPIRRTEAEYRYVGVLIDDERILGMKVRSLRIFMSLSMYWLYWPSIFYRLVKTRLGFRLLMFTSWGSVLKCSRTFCENNAQCEVSVHVGSETERNVGVPDMPEHPIIHSEVSHLPLSFTASASRPTSPPSQVSWLIFYSVTVFRTDFRSNVFWCSSLLIPIGSVLLMCGLYPSSSSIAPISWSSLPYSQPVLDCFPIISWPVWLASTVCYRHIAISQPYSRDTSPPLYLLLSILDGLLYLLGALSCTLLNSLCLLYNRNPTRTAPHLTRKPLAWI